MLIDLSGKVAVVTGGSRGIGRAVALKLAECGADVAVIYSGNSEAATQTCSEIATKAISYKCDVADYYMCAETIKQITEDFGGIDILVNNAGITCDKLIMQMSEQDFDRVVNVNLKGAFNMIRHTVRGFVRKKNGKIINITSVSGMMGNAGQANYSSAKAGLIGLTKTTARELAGKNINVNAVAPGFIETDMTAALGELLDKAKDSIPLKRLGTADDIANAVLFLASDLSNYITGEIIKADGGLYI